MNRSRLAATLVLLVACAADAQQRSTQVYDFDDTAIEGELVQPNAGLLHARPAPRPAEGDLDALSARATRGEATDVERLRLAELLADRSGAHLRESFRAMDEAHAAAARGDRGAEARASRREREELAVAQHDARAAVSVLRDISSDAERGLRARALALEMYLLQNLQRERGVTETARRILRVCPSCPEAAAAHLYLGDEAFLEARSARAIEHYDRVLRVVGASADERSYALYKRGWAHLNRDELGQAWRDLAAARRVDTSGTLAREATADLARVLSMEHVEAAVALERIERVAEDADDRRDLVARYERVLRDSGREGDAEVFAALAR